MGQKHEGVEMTASEPQRFTYKAFISYSHAADGMLAPKLQSGLHQFARPWYQLRTMRVFRDETSLSNTPELWPSIEAALSQSEYFLLLASPEAAKSPWVKKEIEYWVNNRSKHKLLIILTNGCLKWDSEAKGFDRTGTTALPADIKYPFEGEPRYTDFREVKSAEQLSARNPIFRAAVADVASTLLGRSKDELIGEDVRRHRQTKQIAWSAVIALLVLTVASIVAAYVAVQNQKEAEQRRRLAESRLFAAQALNQLQEGRPDRALLLSTEAYDPPYTFEARSALLTALEATPRLSALLSGHSGGVQAVAFSPNGTLLAVAHDSTITLWDAVTHERLGEPFFGHTDLIFSIVFSPDGKTLVSGSRFDKNMIWWDVASHQPLSPPLTAQEGAISGLAFSPDGKMLASGAGDQTIVLWDVSTRQPIGAPLTGHHSNIISLAFSPDGRLLASGSWDATAILWDLETRTPLDTLDYSGQVETVAFSPDGKMLASGAGNTIFFWDVETRQPLELPLQHPGKVNSIAFSPDGQLLASGGSGSDTVMLWSVAQRQALGPPLTAHTSWVNAVAFSPNGQLLASGSQDESVILWDVTARQRLGRVLGSHAGGVTSLAMGADGNTLAVGSCGSVQGGVCQEGEIRLWNLQSFEPLGPPLRGHTGAVRSLAFSADGTTLFSSSCNGFDGSREIGVEMGLWNVSTPQSPVHLDSIPAGEIESAMAISPDGRVLASVHRIMGYEVRLSDLKTGEQLGEPLTGHESIVYNLAFSPDAKMLAASSLNNEVILWDIATGLPLYEPIRGHRVLFSPDGRFLVTVYKEVNAPNILLLWEATTGQRVRETLTEINETIIAVAISHNGRTLALSGYSGKIYLWDMEANQPLGEPLMGHTESVSTLTFTPDDQMLVTGDNSGTVMLWDLRFESWQRLACSIVNRNLTYAEWVQYLGDKPYDLTCPDLPAHPSLLEAGRDLARVGEVSRAVEIIERAVALDKKLILDPQEEAIKLAIPGLLERGRNLAAAGNVDGAIVLFQQAIKLNPSLNLDPKAEAGKWAAPHVVEQGRRLASQGKVKAALETYTRAQTLDPTLEIAADTWSILCWSGCLQNQAAAVMHACRQAVENGSEGDNFYDSRGLARALTNNVEGAIEDFQVFITLETEYLATTRMGWSERERRQQHISRIEHWLAALRAGENPFTPEEIKELQELRNQ